MELPVIVRQLKAQDYYLLPVDVKLTVLHFLTDDVLQTSVIRYAPRVVFRVLGNLL